MGEAGPRVLSGLSIELGHLASRDLGSSAAELEQYFRSLRPCYDYALASTPHSVPISTCVLIDDYFYDPRPPSYVLPNLVQAMEKTDLPLGYLVRESALVDQGTSILKQLTVADESPIRFLRSREESYRHSIVTMVELWDDEEPEGKLSCALLAAVWQLLRLGRVDLDGQKLWSDVTLTRNWNKVPGIIQVDPEAHPLAARQALSILPSSLVPVEHAVRVILDRVARDTTNDIAYTFTWNE